MWLDLTNTLAPFGSYVLKSRCSYIYCASVGLFISTLLSENVDNSKDFIATVQFEALSS